MKKKPYYIFVFVLALLLFQSCASQCPAYSTYPKQGRSR